MNKDSDIWAPIVIGGLAYLAGRQHFQEWEPFKNAYETRGNHLKYNQVIIPFDLFREIDECNSIYREAVYAYLFGLPNASIPMTVRCLELGLKTKYKQIEGKKPPEKLEECIDWSEEYLGKKKESAHRFRLLRNLIHGYTVVQEQDALEALRHVTQILNMLYPFENNNFSIGCDYCRGLNEYSISASALYLGNRIPLLCGQCRRTSYTTVLF